VLLKAQDDSTERSGRVVSSSALYSGGPGLKISAWRPAIQTEVIRCFPQSLHANAWTVPFLVTTASFHIL
jgi:hypothetical protein